MPRNSGAGCIDKVLAQSLPLYRAVKQRAFDGSASPRAAIKAFCLECTGDNRAAIRDCTSLGCTLREYRPYQTETDNE
jgi:hypothetical protein